MREVDGSYGEGGGQIFRMALALSALTGEDVRVTNIRAGRPKPGLAAQHITASNAVASLCDAGVEGLTLGSTEVSFRPGALRGCRSSLDVGTAGSITLVLQACLLPASLAKRPTELEIRGGTDVRWSPPMDYFSDVFLALLRRMGVDAEIQIVKRGYYPRGGGIVKARVSPASSLKPLVLDRRGEVERIRGKAHVSNLPSHVLERMERSATERMRDLAIVNIESHQYDESKAVGPGGALVLWAEASGTRIGSSALAERGVRAEDIGEKVVSGLRSELSAMSTLDIYAADQLLPFMALARGPSTFLVREVSGHAKTMIWLLSRFLDVDITEETTDDLSRIGVSPSGF